MLAALGHDPPGEEWTDEEIEGHWVRAMVGARVLVEAADDLTELKKMVRAALTKKA